MIIITKYKRNYVIKKFIKNKYFIDFYTKLFLKL